MVRVLDKYDCSWSNYCFCVKFKVTIKPKKYFNSSDTPGTYANCSTCCSAQCQFAHGPACMIECMHNCKDTGPLLPPNPNCDHNDPTTVYQYDMDNCLANAQNALLPFLGKQRMSNIKEIAQFSCGTQSVGKGSKSKLFDIAMQWWNFAITLVQQFKQSDFTHSNCLKNNVDLWWNVESGITTPLDIWNSTIYPECQNCILYPQHMLNGVNP